MVELRHLPPHPSVDQLLLRERDGVLDLLQAPLDPKPEVLVEDADPDGFSGGGDGKAPVLNAVSNACMMRNARSCGSLDVSHGSRMCL